nr:hypothetical protein [Tanacetum cinerariifolium]
MEGVTTMIPITSVADKAQRRLELKARSTLMMGIPNEHQLKFNLIKDAKKLLEAIKKRFVNTANEVSTASTQVNDVDNLSDVVICAFLATGQKNKSSEEVTKAVRKNADAPIIKEWVSDDKEENMDQDSAHMVAASKVPMLKPKKGATFPKIQVMEGVTTMMPITSVADKAQRRLELKARSTLMIGIPNEHQLKFNLIKDAKKLLEAIEKRFEMLDQTFDKLQKLVSQLELLSEKLSQEYVYQKLLRSLSPEWNTHVVVWRNKADLDTIINTANGVSIASTQVNDVDNLSDVVICAFLATQPNNPQLAHEDLEQIHPDDMEKMDLRW